MTSFDPRLTPARPDVAAESLRDQIPAERYVVGALRRVTAAVAPLWSKPDAVALASELLYGEGFLVYDQADGLAWGQSTRDDYVGYLPASMLAEAAEPTHWLSATASHRYAAPDLKRPPLHPLYFGGLLAIVDAAPVKGFLPLADGGWVPVSHVRPLGEWLADPLDAAQRFLGAPYLWGGRTMAGIDCSGLIQMALLASGRRTLRDSDMQAATVGEALAEDAPLRRGDIVFFPGHVGIMASERRLLHANATSMAVTIDPLEEVIAIVRREKPDAWMRARRL